MRVVLLLLVCVIASAYAFPRYNIVPDRFDDNDDDADVQDAPYDSFDDMFTFPTGGPAGPPSNQYLSGGKPYGTGRADIISIDDDETNFYLSNFHPHSDYGYGENNEPSLGEGIALARGSNVPTRKVRPDEKDEDEEDEEEEDEIDQDDDSDDEGFSVPDFNELYPNPEGRPRGPGDYNAYIQHSPTSHSGYRDQPQQYNQQHHQQPPQSLQYRDRPSRPQQGPGGPPPPRRYRVELPIESYNDLNDIDDTVVVEAYPPPQYRMSNAEAEDEVDSDEESDDDVDWSVPSYDTLFPQPGNQSPVHGGMRHTWNRPPGPPRGRSDIRDGRFIRLFHSPMNDMYNPEYVIDPTIALDRRNKRMKNRYSNPRWQFLNAKNPYNYKPILYQQGHWGDPREHDYNHASGNHYLGGIYNGKNYY